MARAGENGVVAERPFIRWLPDGSTLALSRFVAKAGQERA
jgi:hypothetical protein